SAPCVPFGSPGQFVPGGPGHAGRAGRARLTARFALWTRIALSVDGATGQSFFLTQPVDGISAGSKGATTHRYVFSSSISPASAQGGGRVCQGCPQACAQRDWTWPAGRRRLSEPSARTDVERGSGGLFQASARRGGGSHECRRAPPPRRGVRAYPAARPGRGTVRPRRDPAVLGV